MSHILAGISFPFRVQNNGLPAPAFGTDVVRYALIVLLKTRKGSRVMRPTLGTDLYKVLFEAQGPFLQSLVQREIITAVKNELPQVRIENIDVSEDGKKLVVNVQYSIQGVRDETGDVDIGNVGGF